MSKRGYRDAKVRVGFYAAWLWFPFGIAFPLMSDGISAMALAAPAVVSGGDALRCRPGGLAGDDAEQLARPDVGRLPLRGQSARPGDRATDRRRHDGLRLLGSRVRNRRYPLVALVDHRGGSSDRDGSALPRNARISARPELVSQNGAT